MVYLMGSRGYFLKRVFIYMYIIRRVHQKGRRVFKSFTMKEFLKLLKRYKTKKAFEIDNKDGSKIMCYTLNGTGKTFLLHKHPDNTIDLYRSVGGLSEENKMKSLEDWFWTQS